ncbi:MAG: hypothetical protein ACLTLL_05740 [Acutalibacteraceae bacterium]
MQILCRRSKNNPCLIGEPGVGKTAIAEGLALRIANGEVPAKLAKKEIHLLDLIASCRRHSVQRPVREPYKGSYRRGQKRGQYNPVYR